MRAPAAVALGIVGLWLVAGCGPAPDLKSEPIVSWRSGPLADPSFFPIMVWVQDPELAPQYKALGINTYMGLWEGPTEEQLGTLARHGMYVICEQNEVGLKHLDDPTIIAWMHGDEPDNRQREYDGPVPLEKILGDYARIKRRDPKRPVALNLGQGVANEEFSGRAISYDQYPWYIRGCDVVSYDVYPVANFKSTDADGKTILRPDGEDYLWYVAKGVRRLREWTGDKKAVWNVIECTHIGNPDRKATPHQIRAEVWMSLINGSKGIVWFVHEFKPTRNAAQLLADDPMKAAVKEINEEVQGLALVLNSPTVIGGASVDSENEDVPIDLLVKRHGGAVYVLAVGMRNGETRGAFHVTGLSGGLTAEVLGEDREIELTSGRFLDHFEPYDVHLYKISLP